MKGASPFLGAPFPVLNAQMKHEPAVADPAERAVEWAPVGLGG